jgi:demethylmenaquinone methyltransferase / 2-methoxy-6-polyprenyl-1,4-benzoquinol methylase
MKNANTSVVLPQNYSGNNKKEKVEAMFNSIASKYDLLNHVLSGGIDYGWRKKVINHLISYHPKNILDVATGTGDLAIAAMKLQPQKITGIDISAGMLEVGRKKIAEKNLSEYIELIQADSASLPFETGAFDAVTVAFGVRNFENLEAGLNEMLRVLKPGGCMVILEFSHPQRFPIKQLYRFYSRRIMPAIGQLLSRQKAAYEYLPESVEAFPYGKRMTDIISALGFANTKCRSLTFGIASIYSAEKKK